MSWGDLSWLSEHGYAKVHEAGERGPETWMRADQATRKHHDIWRELVVRWTGDEHSKEYVELSAAMLDNDGHMIVVSIDEIDLDELRKRLAFYEHRVVQMLRVGLESAAAGFVA